MSVLIQIIGPKKKKHNFHLQNWRTPAVRRWARTARTNDYHYFAEHSGSAANTCRKSAKAFLVAGKLYRFRAIYSAFPPHAFLRFRAQGANCGVNCAEPEKFTRN